MYFLSTVKAVKSGKEKRTQEYENWKIDNVCQANHDKSSEAMEAAGAIQIYREIHYNIG